MPCDATLLEPARDLCAATGPRPTLDAVVARLGAELAAAAAGLKDLQDTLAPLIGATAATPALVGRLQHLDLLEQTVRDLATVTVDVAAETPAIPVDADHLTRSCKLADLAQRLRGRAAPAAEPADVEFF